MYPILARTRWFFIYSYTAVLALGLLISLALIYWRSRKTAVPVWWDGILFGFGGSLILGRIIFIGLEWGYYAERGEGIDSLWRSGLNFHGSILGAILGILLGAWLQKRPFFPLITHILPTIPLLFFFGWGACWLEGCAYGIETTFGPFSSNLPDHLGVFNVRYQTQFGGMILSGLLFIWSWYWGNGRLYPVIISLTFLSHAIITQFRGDDAILISNLRLDILLDIVIAGFCLILLQYNPRGHIGKRKEVA